VAGDPFVEVALFDRGVEAEDAIAAVVTRHFKAALGSAPDVYLVRLERRRYFEDGAHF
jgi:phenylpyruvate tautomerase PptA (4-oxalocrotonate tautomerase family)